MLTAATKNQLFNVSNSKPYDTFLNISFYDSAFENLSMESVAFHDCYLPSFMRFCVFKKCSFNGSEGTTNFEGSIFVNCNFEYTSMRYANFSHCVFINCYFYRADLAMCDFYNIHIDGTSFSCTTFSNFDTRKTRINKSVFSLCVFRNDSKLLATISNDNQLSENCKFINSELV